jgi:hypothetical protein
MASTISIEPRQGIRLSLASCFKIRSYQGGGEFWELQNQQVIRQALGDFLPRADESDGSVLYSHFVEGREVCSESVPAEGGIPQAELTRLQSAVAALKTKEHDPLTDPNAKKLIAAFRLPDPTKDPEFYRVYGSKWSRKLLVLWGAEKEQGSALIPQTALAKLPKESGGAGWLKLWPWMLGMLGLLLIVWAVWDQMHGDGRGAGGGGPADPGQSSLAGTKSGLEENPEGPIEPEPGSLAPLPRDQLEGKVQDAAGLPAANRERPQNGTPSSTSARTPFGTPPVERSGVEGPKAQPSLDRSALGANRSSQEPTPSQSARSAATPSANATRATPPSRLTSASPSTPPGTPSPNGMQRASRSQPSRNTTADSAAAAAPFSTPRSGPAKPEQLAARSTPPSTVPQPGAQRPPLTDSPTAPQNSPDSSSPGMPAVTNDAPPPEAAGPATIEITNSRTATAPLNGKVEVLLNAMARDKEGRFVTLPEVTQWLIDGKPQTVNGKPVTTTALPLQLTKGAHRVSVTGKTADGQLIRSEADVDVAIQVQESGTVQVKPRPASTRAR